MEQAGKTTNMDVYKDNGNGNFGEDVKQDNGNGNEVEDEIIANEDNGNGNDVDDEVISNEENGNGNDVDDDYVIDLADLLPNSDDNPIEYIYHQDATGRVIFVDCRLKVLNGSVCTGNTPGTVSNTTVPNVSTTGSLPPYERIQTTDEFATFCMTFHQN